MLQQTLAIARQVLRTLLTERVTFTPKLDGGRLRYEMRALCSLDKVFSRLLVPQSVVAPTGFVRPWYVEVFRIVELAA